MRTPLFLLTVAFLGLTPALARADLPPFRWSAEGRAIQLDLTPGAADEAVFSYGVIGMPIRFGWMVLPERWLALGFSTGIAATHRSRDFDAVAWEVLPRFEVVASEPVVRPFFALNSGPGGTHASGQATRYTFEASASFGAHFMLERSFSFSGSFEIGFLHTFSPNVDTFRIGFALNLAGWVT